MAAGLASVHTFPSGAELYASPFPAFPSDPATAAEQDASGDEDVADPLSTGIGLMEPADVGVIEEPEMSPSSAVVNLSFLPVFVPMEGVGGSARWCPGWSRLVDLVLSRHPAQVLSDFSRRLVDLRPGEQDCDSVLDDGPQDLAGIAELELGHVQVAERTAAISDYRASLARDPTEYPVANNLGVALERLGPLHVAASEGSLARARALDSKLASRGPVPLLDNTTYISHLDLSKPLPANWTFASSQTHAAVAAAGLHPTGAAVANTARMESRQRELKLRAVALICRSFCSHSVVWGRLWGTDRACYVCTRKKRRGGDSNPRRTERPLPVFETGAFNRSATSPGRRTTS